MDDTILRVDNLSKVFHPAHGQPVQALKEVSFQIRRGEIFSLVGESGSGKSTTGRCVIGLESPSSGTISFSGRQMQIIFQDAVSALSPRLTIGQSVMEPLNIHRIGSRSSRKKKAFELLRLVRLDESSFYRLPSDYSGGQQQRACIARALALEPDLIIADEPVASLDVSIQAQIIGLFQKLRQERGTAFLFIAHDLSLVRRISNTIGVMRGGVLVEIGPAEQVYRHPAHPYTQSLIRAIPLPDPTLRRRSASAPGDPG
ncbi:MAG: ABC transporter ATP-binding protein [Oscillospiraceae bacterium]|nr:ABC transporter ATP-binding protein [Oscillospiraceae bacterium]